MEPQNLLQALHTAERLKDTTRHCYTSGGRHESVAEHSWRIALMAYWLRDAFPEADMDKVIRMCLIHDLGECFTGDIPAFDKTAADEVKEETLLYNWVAALPAPFNTEMRALYEEMAALQTQEAKIYKALDKMEAVVSHNESDIATWEPQEYSLNLTYGVPQTRFAPYMQELREAIRQETLDKMARSCAEAPYEFRHAQPEECAAVLALIEQRIAWMDQNGLHGWNETDYTTYYPLAYYEGIRKDLFVLVDTRSGEVVSAGALFTQDARWPEPAPALYLHNFVSKVGAKGAGTQFLQCAERYARSLGKQALRLDSGANNPGLTAYYEGQGYRPCGTCTEGPYHGILREKKL